MKKRYQSYQWHSQAEPKYEGTRTGNISANKFRKPRKSRWKLYLAIFLLLFLGIVGYLGVNSISAANNILSSKVTISSLLNQGSLEQTDGITNILLLGKGGDNHPGGQLTDSIMLVRYRQSDKAIAMISIPRDLWVTLPDGGQGKINEAYADGYNSVKSSSDIKGKQAAGVTAASATVAKIAGVPIHYTVAVDFEAFKDLVDSVGGVDINVTSTTNINGRVVNALDDPLYPCPDPSTAYCPIYITDGQHHFDGNTALEYARSRETTSDFDRSKRQQDLIYAIKAKMLTLGVLANPIKFSSILTSLGNHISTTFSASDLQDLTKVAKDLSSGNVINKVIDNDPTTGLLVAENNGTYHLVPKAGNFSQVQSFIENVFDSATATADTIPTIEVYNASGITGAGASFADILKAEGLTVTTVQTYSSLLAKTKIEAGSNNSKTLTMIEAKLNNPDIVSGTAGTITVILGKDYGN